MLFLRIENLQISKRKEKSHRGYEKSVLTHKKNLDTWPINTKLRSSLTYN